MAAPQQMLLMGPGLQVQLEAAYDESRLSTDPTDASAGFRLHSDGTIDGAETGNATPSYTIDEGTWLVTGLNSDYEVLATLNSGALDGGTTGTPQVLSTTREWFVSRTNVGTDAANLTIQIRLVATGVVLATATVTLTAEVDV